MERPQIGCRGNFLDFQTGDLIQVTIEIKTGGNKYNLENPRTVERETRCYVIVAAKPGFVRDISNGEFSMGVKWEQLVVARLATDEDHAVIAEQKAAQDAERHSVLSRMMDR